MTNHWLPISPNHQPVIPNHQSQIATDPQSRITTDPQPSTTDRHWSSTMYCQWSLYTKHGSPLIANHQSLIANPYHWSLLFCNNQWSALFLNDQTLITTVPRSTVSFFFLGDICQLTVSFMTNHHQSLLFFVCKWKTALWLSILIKLYSILLYNIRAMRSLPCSSLTQTQQHCWDEHTNSSPVGATHKLPQHYLLP